MPGLAVLRSNCKRIALSQDSQPSFLRSLIAVFWSFAGMGGFLLALYGDVTNKLRYVAVPETSQVDFALGFGNFSIAFAIGFSMYMWGQVHQPPPPTYHDLETK